MIWELMWRFWLFRLLLSSFGKQKQSEFWRVKICFGQWLQCQWYPVFTNFNINFLRNLPAGIGRCLKIEPGKDLSYLLGFGLVFWVLELPITIESCLSGMACHVMCAWLFQHGSWLLIIRNWRFCRQSFLYGYLGTAIWVLELPSFRLFGEDAIMT